MHHYIHQQARAASASFWAGCGAVRKQVFEAVGGFSSAYTRPSIEDIELGNRLARAGYEIRLDKDLKVKHLKAWNLGSILRSDIFDRALPWSRLLKQSRTIPADLNLKPAHRLSALLVWLVLASFFIAFFVRWMWLVVALGVLLLLALNADLYRFFVRKRGLSFAARALFLHWFYYLYSSAVFAYVWLLEAQSNEPAPTSPTPRV
jgi:GT2 family glycosyltransferase